LNHTLTKLLEAQEVALALFKEVEKQQLIVTGKLESELNAEVYQLGESMFGIKKHWHKRIVRAGKNTLKPYKENPENLTIKAKDIIFFDFGPIIENWEADLGRTYVLGNNAKMIKLKEDVESAWFKTKDWFFSQENVTGAQLYQYVCDLAKQYGWQFGGDIAGHLIGEFPHENIKTETYPYYIRPENKNELISLNARGEELHWILEIHFIDTELEIGGFYEQVLV